MANKVLPQELDHYFQLGLTLIPPKPRSKEPLLKRRNGSDFLFPRADGGPMSTNSVQQLLRRLADRCGLSGIKCTRHTFRHTFATESMAHDANAFVLKEVMGHSSLQTTLKYVHMQPQEIQSQHTRFSPLANLRKQSEL